MSSNDTNPPPQWYDQNDESESTKRVHSPSKRRSVELMFSTPDTPDLRSSETRKREKRVVFLSCSKLMKSFSKIPRYVLEHDQTLFVRYLTLIPISFETHTHTHTHSFSEARRNGSFLRTRRTDRREMHSQGDIST